MTKHERKEYTRLRTKEYPWPAKAALHAAKTLTMFATLEREGYVRLRVEPDEDPDTSYLDDREFNTEAQAKAELRRMNQLGVWGIIVEARNPLAGDDGPWEQIESCWGFVGDDWKDSGHDTDFMDAAIDWLRQFEDMAA